MDQAVWRTFAEVLPYATIGIASPAAIMVEIMVLATKRGRANAWAYVLGWFLAMLGVGGVLLLLGDALGLQPGGGNSTASSILRLLAGFLFIGLALASWRRQAAREQAGEPPQAPKWMQSLDKLTLGRAFILGAILGTALAPANIVADIGAVVDILQAGLGGGQALFVYLLFCLISMLGGVAPVLVATLMGERADKPLGKMRAWLALHGDAVTMATLFIFGFVFVSKGLGGLLG